MAKVHRMGTYTNDATRMIPTDALAEAHEDIKRGYIKPTKCIIIMLDDSDGYTTRFVQAGMKCSEIVSLLEIMKHNIIVDQMGL